MTAAELLQKTASVLPAFNPSSLTAIEKGGSSRCFFRVLSSENKSAILVQDLGEKEENRHYAALADFLASRGVPVPRVLAKGDGEGLLWLEDLGEVDLWAARNEPWEVRRPLYESALRGISLMHRIAPESPLAEGLQLQSGFDERLYRWEQAYFTDHCLGDLFGVGEEIRRELLDHPGMKRLASDLSTLARHLVHRDFQSQNILIRSGDAWFIDFQGMRPGLAQYDLASLLCDPYVMISAGEREHLLDYYCEVRRLAGTPVGENFNRVFWQCAVQRLMQALGAYGYLSIHRGKTSFRAHVPAALSRLREALASLYHDDRLDVLGTLLADLKA
jgi:hypothetical protein